MPPRGVAVAKIEALQAMQELEASRSALRAREVELENRDLALRASVRYTLCCKPSPQYSLDRLFPVPRFR